MSTIKFRNLFGLASAAVATLGLVGSTLLLAPPVNGQEQGNTGNQPGVKSTNASEDTQHAEDESQELGIIAGSCPGQGVCVLDIVWGSPAQEADIQHGDYILSFDGTDVSTPSN